MNSNQKLVQSLIEDGYLKSPEIIAAFEAIDRVDFMAEEYKGQAYENLPFLIGFGQTISQPLTVAFMLELLEPKAGYKILDVGSGSGWQAALLAWIVNGGIAEGAAGRPAYNASHNTTGKGLVVAIERIPALKTFGEKNIGKYNLISNGFVKCVLGDGSRGYKKDAPYDGIIAGAASEGDVPLIWKKQLKIGGRIVAPVGNSVVVIDKISKNKYNRKEYFGFSFVPLIIDSQRPTIDN